MSGPLTPEAFAAVMDKHRERQLTGPTHCGPMCEPDILRLAARAAAPPVEREFGDWFRWRHAGQCAFERGDGSCDCGLTAQQQALSRAAAPPVEPHPGAEAAYREFGKAIMNASPDPVAGLREALNKAARRHHLAAGSPWPFEECQEPWCVEARAALLASDKPDREAGA